MKKIAILGGGISGLAAAYELEKARLAGAAIDWHLYEASDRLGGIIQTTRADGYLLEGGPDGWVTEKPWATELCKELGLEGELIYSNDATRKTYILKDGKLQAIPDGMRMMVPESLDALEGSPLFSAEAKAAYAAEVGRAEELKASAPDEDESVAEFVRRHFGEEVLTTLAAPLLSGVFGGDVNKLSVRAVMPQFVKMEREHGSLIVALRAKSKGAGKPIFTSLRGGVGALPDALVARLPADRIHLNSAVLSVKREGKLWCVRHSTPSERGIPGKTKKHFKEVLLATPLDVTRAVLESRDASASALLPAEASSAILVAFTWPAELAAAFALPQGFGFLVPPAGDGATTPLLACTFVDQKFPARVPKDARVLRAFFGGASAAALQGGSDEAVATAALVQLREILGVIPDPAQTSVRRLPRSLPQYEVGHLERIARLDESVAGLPGLTLLGNAFRGVGLPDLVRDARAAARKIVENTAL